MGAHEDPKSKLYRAADGFLAVKAVYDDKEADQPKEPAGTPIEEDLRDVTKMAKKELLAYAKEKGVKVSDKMNRNELIAKLGGKVEPAAPDKTPEPEDDDDVAQ